MIEHDRWSRRTFDWNQLDWNEIKKFAYTLMDWLLAGVSMAGV